MDVVLVDVRIRCKIAQPVVVALCVTLTHGS